MNEQTMTHVSEETCTSRVNKYLERIEDKPKNRKIHFAFRYSCVSFLAVYSHC